jgi:hypothetical protein
VNEGPAGLTNLKIGCLQIVVFAYQLLSSYTLLFSCAQYDDSHDAMCLGSPLFFGEV